MAADDGPKSRPGARPATSRDARSAEERPGSADALADAAAPARGAVLGDAVVPAGARLDAAAAELLPGMGLRGRRRCIHGGAVLVNGVPRRAAYKLRPGDVLSLAPGAAAPGESRPGEAQPDAARLDEEYLSAAGLSARSREPRMLTRMGGYCFFYKPAGLHSAALAGGRGPSLEALLPRLTDFSSAMGAGERPRLLQRLDWGTSGLVCAALTPEAAASFRRAEAAGLCEKRYLALLTGRLEAPATARRALDVRDRRKSGLLDATRDATRWTEFFPLRHWAGEEAERLLRALALDCPGPGSTGCFSQARSQGLTLAGCRIRRGTRHQIRAHAAALGHALWGDALYGGGREPATNFALDGGEVRPGCFFLHHGGLRLPEAACSMPPAWASVLVPPEGGAALRWLAGVALGLPPEACAHFW